MIVVHRVALALAIGLALLSAGCDEDASADPGHTSRWPAAAAGMACQLIEYDVVAAATGTRFDAAGGAKQEETLTCALTQSGNQYPYLTVAMTPTTADEVIFTATVTPSGATAVKGLGRIAYQLGIAPAGPAGPGVELGWLSDSGYLMIMRYTFALTARPDEVAKLGPKLLVLAQQVESRLALI